jgi:hypothetical protein
LISAEIKVNGVLIYHVYAHNSGAHPTKAGQTLYRYQVVEIGIDKPSTQNLVMHTREAGALKLIEKILKDAQDDLHE